MSFLFLTTTFYFIPKGQLQYIMIFVSALMISGTFGTVSAPVMDVVHKGIRATAVSAGVFIQNMIGFGTGPLVTGQLSDSFGLEMAMAITPMFSIIAAALFYITLKLYDKDIIKQGN